MMPRIHPSYRSESNSQKQIRSGKVLGVSLYIGITGSNLCAVSAMLDYLNMREMSLGPLFRFADGRALLQQLFVEAVRDGLRKAGINQDKYCGHSFRIGAATTAAAKGIEDSLIDFREMGKSSLSTVCQTTS